MPPSPFFQGAPTQSPPRSGTTSPRSGTTSPRSGTTSPSTTSPSSNTTSGSGQRAGNRAASPPAQQEANAQKKSQSSKTKRIVGISIASVIGFIILVLALLLCLPWCFSRSKDYYRTTKRHEIQPYMGARENPLNNGSSRYPNNQSEKGKSISYQVSYLHSFKEWRHYVLTESQALLNNIK